jgi:hypothetical protein
MAETSGQNLENHKQMVPMYHYFLLGLTLVTLIGSFVNLAEAIMHKEGLYSASLICCITVSCMIGFLLMRSFAMRVQDRAIRAEENFRHYVLTGKALDPRIHMRQVIALRFAPDEEMPALAAKAVAENLKAGDIKRAIKNWRGDYFRA